MAKSKEQTQQQAEVKAQAKPEVKRTRKLVTKAGPCPKSPIHTATKVYRTDGRTRYCKCNDCGHTWKVLANYADDLHQYAHELADDLETAARVEVETGLVVVLSDEQATRIAAELRGLIESPS